MVTDVISSYIIPTVLLATTFPMLICDKGYYKEIEKGIREGISVTLGIFPSLLMLIIGVGMLSASGVIEYFASIFSYISEPIGLPPELLPLILVRPVSGSGALAAASEIFEKYGTDSFIGFCASVIMGASDTLVYVIAVYLSGSGYKKTRHAFPAAILTMIFSLFISCAAARLFWK